MRRSIDQDPAFRRIAKRMGITASRDLRSLIADAAVRRVEHWMDELGVRPTSLDDVQSLVLNQTGITIERVQFDSDLARVASSYKGEHQALPVQLELEFTKETEALVFRRPAAAKRFLAVVDARGHRAYRAWFAERHEPSHLLIEDPSANVVWRRTTVKRPEPVEQVVDEVASRVGFWAPIVWAELHAAGSRLGRRLEAFAAAYSAIAPGASREAAYRAFCRLTQEPLVLLRVDYGARRSGDSTSYALRAQTVIDNDAARKSGLRIWRNYRIPVHSVIHEALSAGGFYSEVDDLSRWRSSSGTSLPRRRVLVTASGSWVAIEPG